MSEEIVNESKPFVSYAINGVNFILPTSTDSMTTVLTIGGSEFEKSNQLNIIENIESEKAKETVPLVCLEELAEADLTTLVDNGNCCSENAIAIFNESQRLESNHTFNENIQNNDNYRVIYEKRKGNWYTGKEKINDNDFVEITTAFKCKVCPFTTQDQEELLSHLQDAHVYPGKEFQVREILHFRFFTCCMH